MVFGRSRNGFDAGLLFLYARFNRYLFNRISLARGIVVKMGDRFLAVATPFDHERPVWPFDPVKSSSWVPVN
jgi:hypothetical protein